MSEKKQSSIDWFIKEFISQIQFTMGSELDEWFNKIIWEARDKFEQDIIEVYKDVEGYNDDDSTLEAQHYFSQKFKP